MKAWHAVHKAYSSEVAAALPKKKKVRVLFPPKEEEVAEPVKEVAEPKEIPIPRMKSLPGSMPKLMNEWLAGMEETHNYTSGLGHPIDFILKQINKHKGHERYWGREQYKIAEEYYEKVEDYVKSKSIDATFMGKPQKIILVKDWEKIFD
jgi:hypothetical protein